MRLDNHIIFPCQVDVLMAILSCGCRAIELNLIGRDCKSTLCIRQRMCVCGGENLSSYCRIGRQVVGLIGN